MYHSAKDQVIIIIKQVFLYYYQTRFILQNVYLARGRKKLPTPAIKYRKPSQLFHELQWFTPNEFLEIYMYKSMPTLLAIRDQVQSLKELSDIVFSLVYSRLHYCLAFLIIVSLYLCTFLKVVTSQAHEFDYNYTGLTVN